MGKLNQVNQLEETERGNPNREVWNPRAFMPGRMSNTEIISLTIMLEVALSAIKRVMNTQLASPPAQHDSLNVATPQTSC
ncbi:MAG: hypothetical protein F6K26_43595 [Moorea sp. SIO2I5]|nr:hypothetical protein [Moorena sp. SIO2I5]